eukprot:3174273-Prymnesium_polylepis.4
MESGTNIVLELPHVCQEQKSNVSDGTTISMPHLLTSEQMQAMKYKLIDMNQSAAGVITYFYVPDDSPKEKKEAVKAKKDVKVKQEKKSNTANEKAKRKREESSDNE